MKRELPGFIIEGTYFIVYVSSLQFRQKENPENVIPVFDMQDVGDGYVFRKTLESSRNNSSNQNKPMRAGRPASGNTEARSYEIECHEYIKK